jgi:hypothetical protein
VTWITTLAAPDLSALAVPVIAHYWAHVAFTNQGGSNDSQVRSYIHSYILATDKALRAYNLGRTLLLEYAQSSNRATLLVHGLAEFETCITTVRRCTKLATRMAAHPENPDERFHAFVESYGRGPSIRNRIEHMDDDIHEGEGAGVPAVLEISRDGTLLRIREHQLLLTKLAECLGELHILSMAVASRER